ncbi:MAG: YraN family protein [Chloroflexota bacterium]
MKRQATGRLGEKLAGEFLAEQGYVIRETNYRCAEGEVDLIAEHRGALVFVEVKTRRSRDFGIPEEAVTPAKMAKLRRVAETYLQEQESPPENWRIDVVAIELAGGRIARIELFENAVADG